MLEDLEALNERIYELYGRLYENGELLTKKQSDYIADRLFEQYKKEYEILKLNTEPDRATAQYRAEERGELLTPRSPCWFKRLFGQRKNKAAELIEREEQKTAEEGFAARESLLDSQADEPNEEQAAEGAGTPSESAAGPIEQGSKAEEPSEEQAAEGAENPSESAVGPIEQGGKAEKPSEEQAAEGVENPSETAAGPTEQGADKPSEEQAAEGAENPSESAAGPTEPGSQVDELNEETGEMPSESAEEQTERSGQTQEQAETVEQESGGDIALQEKNSCSAQAEGRQRADGATS